MRKAQANGVWKVEIKRTGIRYTFQGNLSTWPASSLMTAWERARKIEQRRFPATGKWASRAVWEGRCHPEQDSPADT